jgi:hypothetical protein
MTSNKKKLLLRPLRLTLRLTLRPCGTLLLVDRKKNHPNDT